jgi:drug/metabolite transporter (DMT)-like permease
MKDLIFAIVSPILSSVLTIFKTRAIKLLDIPTFLFFNAFFGLITLVVFALFKRDKLDLGKIKRNGRQLFSLVATRYIIADIILVFGLSQTDAIKAIFFTKAEPYFVLLWHWLLNKERVKASHLALLAFHISGAIILSTGGKFTGIGSPQVGDLAIILAMGFYSYSYFPASKIVKSLGPQLPNMIGLLVAGIVFAPIFLFFSGNHVFKYSIGWVYLVVQAILLSSVSLTLWFASLKTVKEWMVSALRSVGPLIGAPFAYFFFGETLTLIQIIGAGIVLTTSFLIAREHLKSNK